MTVAIEGRGMSGQLIQSLLDAAPLPQIVIGADERVVAANEFALNLLGRGILQRHYVTALRQPDLLDCIEGVLSGRTGQTEAPFLATQARRDVTYRAFAGPLELDGSRSLLLSFMDVTDVQAAGQMRRDFVANVSHELRTPLTALLGFIETLRGAAKDDAIVRARFLGTMEREATRMNRLVRDLLSLSQVESDGRMRPSDTVNVVGVVQAAAESLSAMAADAGVEVRLSFGASSMRVLGDADQLTQVIGNLLENAIKYGASGKLATIDVEAEEDSSAVQGDAVIIVVGDNGEGFDPIHIPRLTERFYRVDAHRSREMGGTGLGLAIVKHIVNRHRGRLRIETTPGKGSRFTIILPQD